MQVIHVDWSPPPPVDEEKDDILETSYEAKQPSRVQTSTLPYGARVSMATIPRRA